MLLIILPGSNILVAVCEDHSALATLQSTFEVSSVALAVLVGELAFALEYILFEVALVCSFEICEVVHTVPREHTVIEVTVVVAAIGPLVATLAYFLAFHVLATELDLSKLPSFFSKSMLVVVDPLAITNATLCVNEAPIAIEHIVFPIALIDAAIGFSDTTLATSFVVLELADIARTISPCKHAYSVHNLLSINFAPIDLLQSLNQLTIDLDTSCQLLHRHRLYSPL